MSLPKFVKEGYALYDRKYKTNPFTNEILLDENNEPIPYYGRFDFIGIKPDAPKWALTEYNNWLNGLK